MITVMVVDDHELVRSAVEHLINGQEGLRVVGAARSGEDALDLLASTEPDVLLLDVNMPGIGGVETCRRALRKHPHIKIIALSAYEQSPVPQQLLRLGVHGYLAKSCPVEEMIQAILHVHQGKRYVCNKVARNIALNGREDGVSPFQELSRREMQIVLLILQGFSPNDIGDTLALSPKTINTYRFRAYQKLNIDNEMELFHLALKHQLFQDSPPPPIPVGAG
jgi:two-component system invasion response regulator UvrY